jgi:hypothetical protein
MVGGSWVIDHGKPTGAHLGQVIRSSAISTSEGYILYATAR